MADYAFLVLPGFNSVYADASPRLAQAELGVLNEALFQGRLQAIRETRFGGVPYICFSAACLCERDIRFLSNLSSMLALFEVAGRALLPIDLQPLDRFSDDLITIQKYKGKTNPLFTKLLMNVTLAAGAFAHQLLDRGMTIFDPLCGRGTTLNQGLMYGYDAAGMEIDDDAFAAYAHFIRTWLKQKRLKHDLQMSTLRENKRPVGRRLTVELALTKELFKAKRTMRLDVMNADAVGAGRYFKAATFDAIITDLPYGVRHGSRSAESALSRRPLDLLAAALPAWADLLREGGTIGLAWNTHVASRDRLVAILARSGLEPVDWPYQFRHVVDQSITRDVVVARKPPSPGTVAAHP